MHDGNGIPDIYLAAMMKVTNPIITKLVNKWGYGQSMATTQQQANLCLLRFWPCHQSILLNSHHSTGTPKLTQICKCRDKIRLTNRTFGNAHGDELAHLSRSSGTRSFIFSG
jgi:hypothetical protein